MKLVITEEEWDIIERACRAHNPQGNRAVRGSVDAALIERARAQEIADRIRVRMVP